MIFTVFVTLPALLIWLFLFPLFVICKMRSQSKTITNSNIRHSDLSPQEKTNVNNVKAQFGFFFVGLKINIDGKDDEEGDEEFKRTFTKYLSNNQYTFAS